MIQLLRTRSQGKRHRTTKEPKATHLLRLCEINWKTKVCGTIGAVLARIFNSKKSADHRMSTITITKLQNKPETKKF